MTINKGIVRGKRRTTSRGRSQISTTAAAASANIGVREAVARTPIRINDVGAHQTRDRDFASATPSGMAIANRTPSAIG